MNRSFNKEAYRTKRFDALLYFKGCNMCAESCPVQVTDKQTKTIDYKACIECMCCHELCMHKAVKLRKVNPAAGIMIKLMGGKYK